MDNYLFISDAAKEVKVESHVLRYWEEELHLPIKRNELGHRYYTHEDVERFKQIKGMKERGLQLKAIRMILRDGKLDMLPEEGTEEKLGSQSSEQNGKAAELRSDGQRVLQRELQQDERFTGMGIEIVEERVLTEAEAVKSSAVSAEYKEDKARRLQWLLQEMIRQTVQEANKELSREIRDSVVKELDYQFRMQEEREEAREKRLAERDEAYYQRMDELLRKKSRKGRVKKEKASEMKSKVEAQSEGEIMSAKQEESENVEWERLEMVDVPEKTRERSVEAVEEAIREKSQKRKKRHFF